MASGRRTVMNKIQPRHLDMSPQSSLESCPPKEKSEDDLQQPRQSCHNSEESSIHKLPSPKRTRTNDTTMSIRRYENIFGGIQRSRKNFRLNRPEHLDTSLSMDSSSSSSSISIPPPAPRHASESDIQFFPSPRSVLERRTSTGSFF